ncbi:MAG: hypothetical protein ACE5F6_15675 [Anaerolineae bacterium]
MQGSRGDKGPVFLAEANDIPGLQRPFERPRPSNTGGDANASCGKRKNASSGNCCKLFNRRRMVAGVLAEARRIVTRNGEPMPDVTIRRRS